jgi:hypothetical protein
MPDFPLNPDALASAIDLPLSDWPGNCHGVATLIVDLLPVAGMRLVRGHFHGDIASTSVYRGPFCQHSWLELADGRILDPTRWAIERPKSPYIYLGVNDAYDEAGIQIAQTIRPSLLPTKSGARFMVDKLAAPDIERLSLALGSEPEMGTKASVSRRLDVVLNSSPEALENATEIYGLLNELGMKSLIKIDLWNAVMEREKFTSNPGSNREFTLPESDICKDEAKLLSILAHFLSLEERDYHFEGELKEIGYTIEQWHDALNHFERVAVKGDFVLDELPRPWVEPLAMVAADILGKGFGVALKVERFAKSLGLDRKAFDDLLRRLGAQARYDVGWL